MRKLVLATNISASLYFLLNGGLVQGLLDLDQPIPSRVDGVITFMGKCEDSSTLHPSISALST